MKLIKCSMPGWTKEFDNEAELKEELFNNLCSMCVNGVREEFEVEGEQKFIYETDPVSIDSTIDEMLSTACGLEFEVEK